MPVLFVPVGISGSGKSTYFKGRGIDVVSSDSIRKELFGDESCQNDPKLVFELAHNRVRETLESGKDVVFDATNVSKWARDELMKAVPAGVKKVCILFLVGPEEALARQKKRARQVPEDVVIRQWDTMLSDLKFIPNEFDEIVTAQDFKTNLVLQTEGCRCVSRQNSTIG